MKNNENSTVISGLFWKFGERICAQSVSFIVSIVLARLLLPSEYGAVALIMVFITIANVFVTSGFSSALIQKKNADRIDFSTIFYCTLVMSIVLYLILFLISPLVAKFYKMPELNWYLRVFSLKILISSYNSIQHAYVSRHMIFKKFFYSTIIGTIISGIIGIWMAYSGFGAWAIIVQYLSNSLIDTLVLSITVPWHPQKVFSKKSAKSLLGFGWKVLATDLLGTIFDNLRSLLIGRLYTSADLAFYNKGQQFPSLIGNNIDSSLTTVLFPAMSNSNDDVLKVKKMTRKSMKMSSYVMFPLMGGLIAVSKPLIFLLLTEKWSNSIIYMQILCVSQAMSTISRANIQAMKAMGRSDITLKLEFIKKPIYLIMLIISIQFGVFAIALSMMLYSFIATLLNMKPNKEILHYSIKEQIVDLTPATVLSVIMCLAIIQLTRLNILPVLTIICQIVVGATIYITLSIIFKLDSINYLMKYIHRFIGGKKFDT